MKIADTLMASFTMLTRLPFWRLRRIPDACYAAAVEGWPAVGWLTAGVTAGVLWLCAQLLPATVAVALALGARLFLTGAMHEDGLSDFFDGFGGGCSRERTLEIMKDSRIGAYGVIGLMVYFFVLIPTLASMPLDILLAAILSVDPLAKFMASQVVNILPYARPAGESKNGTVYRRMGVSGYMLALPFGLLPAVLFFQPVWWSAVPVAAAVFGILIGMMYRRIGGYTGDCCGALLLLCELSLYLTICAFTV